MLKSLELAGKRAIIRLIAALMREGADGERPDWRLRPYRVLFLRHDRIGDMILTTGILRAIAQAYPTIQLDVLASPINAPILPIAPFPLASRLRARRVGVHGKARAPLFVAAPRFIAAGSSQPTPGLTSSGPCVQVPRLVLPLGV